MSIVKSINNVSNDVFICPSELYTQGKLRNKTKCMCV